MRFTKGEHAFVVADRQHIHNHVIFNSTALDGTRKFRDFSFGVGSAAVERPDLLTGLNLCKFSRRLASLFYTANAN